MSALSELYQSLTHGAPTGDAGRWTAAAEDTDRFMEFLTGVFKRGKTMSYGGGQVTMCAHMLQAAALAEQAGATAALVAASLLHDIGHFGTDYPFNFEDDRHTVMLSTADDRRHEEVGARLLYPFLGARVAEPVRLHVAAKRYLCATEPAYYDRLSKTTRHTLGLQGGPMTTTEAKAFDAEPYAGAATELRRWDDLALVGEKEVAEFDHYRSLLESLVGAQTQDGGRQNP